MGWPVAEILIFVIGMAADRWFCLSGRLEARVRRLRSEKARVGVRTLVYGATAAAVVLVLSLEDIFGSGELDPPQGPVLAAGFLIVFIVAMIRTAGEDDEVDPE